MNYPPFRLKNPQFSVGLITTFLDNLLVYWFRKIPSRGPVAVVWNITQSCNLKCRFCNSWAQPAQSHKLSLPEKISIIDNIADSGVKYLSLCGGEPLICQDLEEVIKKAKKRGLAVNISTNGKLLKEKALMLVNAGVDMLTISMDSHSAQVHNNLRGCPHLFEDILTGIEEVKRLRKNKKQQLRIYMRCLISSANAFNIREYLSFWNPISEGVVFKPIYDNKNCFYNTPTEMFLSENQKAEFKVYFLEVIKKYPALNSLYNRLLPDFFLQSAKLDKYSCFAGNFFATIDSSGNLYSCLECPQPHSAEFGNLIKEDFMSLWKNSLAANFRLNFKNKKNCFCWSDRFNENIKIEALAKLKVFHD